jgi:hypothetical protein
MHGAEAQKIPVLTSTEDQIEISYPVPIQNIINNQVMQNIGSEVE